MNPTPGNGEKYLATSLDFDRPEADARLAIEMADYFRVGEAQMREYLSTMAGSVGRWAAFARADGISEASIRHMRSCFEGGIESLERCLAYQDSSS